MTEYCKIEKYRNYENGNFKRLLKYFAKDKPPTLTLGGSEQRSKGASEQFKERGKTHEPKTTTTTTTTTPTLALGGSEQRSPAELLAALSSHNI